MRLEYATIFNYHSRCQTQAGKDSVKAKNWFKGGKEFYIGRAIDIISKPDLTDIRNYLSDLQYTLVPVPRSHQIKPGSIWPSLTICNEMLNRGYGYQVSQIISRTKTIRSNSTSIGNRSTVAEQRDSIKIDLLFSPSNNFILVDDILSTGTTMYACALEILVSYPGAHIKTFSLMRTRHFETEITDLVEPFINWIHYIEPRDKCERRDY